MSDENVAAPTTSDYSLNPQLSYIYAKISVEFKGSYLKEDKITYTHGKIINIYIVDEISKNYNISSYSTLENCLFGAVSLTKMLILISVNILGVELDLIDMDFFSF